MFGFLLWRFLSSSFVGLMAGQHIMAEAFDENQICSPHGREEVLMDILFDPRFLNRAIFSPFFLSRS